MSNHQFRSTGSGSACIHCRAAEDQRHLPCSKREKWQTLTESLAELAREDPAVAKAEQRLDDYLWRMATGIPIARFPRGDKP